MAQMNRHDFERGYSDYRAGVRVDLTALCGFGAESYRLGYELARRIETQKALVEKGQVPNG